MNIDLKNQLLNNILTANSENPGKLISDYKKSDHPAEKAVTKVTDKLNLIETLEKNPSLIDQLKSLLSSKDKKVMGLLPLMAQVRMSYMRHVSLYEISEYYLFTLDTNLR